MIEDAQYREEVRTRESLTTRIQKEVNPKGYKEATGKNSQTPIFTQDGSCSATNIDTINNIIRKGFHSICNLDSHDAEEMREQSIFWSYEHKQFSKGDPG